MYKSIYPIPKNIEFTEGEFTFGVDVFLQFKNGNDKDILREMWYQFTYRTSKPVIIENYHLGDFQAIISSKPCETFSFPLLGQSEYSIEINSDGIFINASCRNGLIHGFETVVQLIRPRCLEEGNEDFYIPCVKINDDSGLAFRGIHLCVFPETQLILIEKVIRLAGFLKFTHIILEFWGTYRYKAMKELYWQKESFTKEQIKPLVRLANDYGMEIIPMINHLGHASSSRVKYGRHVVLNQNPRKALLFEPDGWTWCLSNPDTFKLLSEMREEQMELCGKGSYFHLGFDEAYSFATCELCEQQDGPLMLAEYLNRIAQLLRKNNRRAIIWGDQFLDRNEWKRPYIATSKPDQQTHKALELLNNDIIIADWQYDIIEGEVKTSKYFMEKGFDTILCPWDKIENIKALSKEAYSINAYGVLLTTWHHFPEYLRKMPIAANLLYNGEEISLYGTENAKLLRTLVHTGENYTYAGWNYWEVN